MGVAPGAPPGPAQVSLEKPSSRPALRRRRHVLGRPDFGYSVPRRELNNVTCGIGGFSGLGLVGLTVLCVHTVPRAPCAHTTLAHMRACHSPCPLPSSMAGGQGYTLAYRLPPSFLCLRSCRPGALRAGLPRGFQKTSQIMRGNVVISS